MQDSFSRGFDVAAKTAAAVVIAAFCFAARRADADTMKVGTKQYKGTFEGYEKGKFVFRTSDGNVLSETRAKVRELKLTKPRKADLVRTSGTKSEEVLLRGYASSKFSYTKKGRTSSLPGMHVRQITVEIPMVAGGRGMGGTEAKPIAPIDISGLEGRGDLTAAQSAAVAGYKNARLTYDKFMAESSALVAKMDSLKGAARESVLNTLRSRKDQEQPVKNALVASQNELLAAFPNGFPTGPEIPQGGGGGGDPVLERTEIVMVIPNLGPGEICILDTTVLKNGPLNDAQKAALAGYDKATKNYADFANAPDADAGSDKAAALMNGLQNAHSTLLKAFPNLKLVPEGSQ